METKIKEFIKGNKNRIILIIGFILVSAVSFETGYFKGKEAISKPIVIENPSLEAKNAPGEVLGAQNTKDTTISPKSNNEPISNDQTCTYVGSKNSTKVHISTCQWAKRIKPENRVCFSSLEDAISKGRVADKGCIK